MPPQLASFVELSASSLEEQERKKVKRTKLKDRYFVPLVSLESSGEIRWAAVSLHLLLNMVQWNRPKADSHGAKSVRFGEVPPYTSK